MKSAWDCIYVPAVRHFDEVEVNFAALGSHRLMCTDTVSHCTAQWKTQNYAEIELFKYLDLGQHECYNLIYVQSSHSSCSLKSSYFHLSLCLIPSWWGRSEVLSAAADYSPTPTLSSPGTTTTTLSLDQAESQSLVTPQSSLRLTPVTLLALSTI